MGLVELMGLVLFFLASWGLKTTEIYSVKYWRLERKRSNSLLYIVVVSPVETEIVDDDGNLRL